jgi:hypothetical protein
MLERTAGAAVPTSPAAADAPPPGRPSPLGSSHPSHRFGLLVRLVLVVLGVGLFVVALGLMKAGAEALVPTLDGSVFTDGVASALGLGWLGACLVLSGSPVAASALTLLDGGAIDRDQAFAMLTGSRLGASFVVLAVGALYAVRKDRRGDDDPKAPLSIGILSFTMTAVAYLPGAFIGLVALQAGWLDDVHLAASPEVVSVSDSAFGWAVDGAQTVLPDWALFPLGVAVLLLAFKVVDEVLPSVGEQSVDHRSSRWFSTPWLMFALGCLVAFLTLSVSVALTVLVPIVASGRLKREDALPYIAGANITTLADTLVAAVVLGNQDAVRVVLAEAGGVTVWTLVLLGLLYPQVKAFCLTVSDTVLASRGRLVGFVGALFVVPILLIAA